MSLLQFNSHSLVEIKPSEWQALRALYAQKRRESTGYNLINNYIKWIAQDPQLDIKCFSLDGDWKNDGTFLMCVNYGAAQREAYFNTLSDNLERLTSALLCLPSESNAYLLAAYGERLIPAVTEYKKKIRNPSTNQTAFYSASKELVATFSTEPPAGIELRSLQIKDAPTINEIWPHRSPGSVEYVKRLIRHNVSVGAYDEEGKLIAWCLRQPIGALSLLQVLETHKRLGLGSLMVRYLSRKISDLGDEVMAPVITENTASRQMFEKLGFQKIDNVYWTW
ncbi:GH11464 [Drosophila grimshawi]|uniref:GH11464 n=1 Tax=Drosophila grimshawi TaxID=7222 RepID=B4JAP3_DROGR|nr:GH11464 [Drosophila grimshawi]